MNLRQIDDGQLILTTEKLVREERELLTRILWHLEEIQRRRLFSSLGYKSLFDFAVRKLGYSEDQAYRRISAMRLLVQLPEIEERINEGSLSLSHINLAQNFFKQEEKLTQKSFSNSEKLEVFDQIAQKSIREAERTTLSFSSSPAQHRSDRVRAISAEMIEMKLLASVRLEGKIEKLKGFLAHKCPGISSGDLFEKLCDLGIEEYDPASPSKGRIQKKISRSRISRAKANSRIDTRADVWARLDTDTNFNAKVNLSENIDANTKSNTNANCDTEAKANTIGITETNTKAMRPATFQKHCDIKLTASRPQGSKCRPKRPNESVRRMLFKKAKGRCVNCDSTYALEIDHHQPQALGGSSKHLNLRVLCRSCNQRSGIRAFGLALMDPYINKVYQVRSSKGRALLPYKAGETMRPIRVPRSESSN